MRITDDTLLAELNEAGLGPGELFVAGNAVFISEHAGDFQATSAYQSLPAKLAERQEALLSLARRLDAPEYVSLAEVDDQILQSKEWEDIYSKLMRLLPEHGVHDAFGNGDYCLIDDYCNSPQRKIECTSSAPLMPLLLSAIQVQLMGYSREWEVILVQERAAGTVHVTLVYSDRWVEPAPLDTSDIDGPNQPDLANRT